jgi:hypothetical protein
VDNGIRFVFGSDNAKLAVGDILIAGCLWSAQSHGFSEYLGKNPNTLPVTCCLDQAWMNELTGLAIDRILRAAASRYWCPIYPGKSSDPENVVGGGEKGRG